MIRRPPRSPLDRSSAASDVYKRQVPVPVLCSVTFGTPMQLQDGEDRRVFLERARAAVVALRDV